MPETRPLISFMIATRNRVEELQRTLDHCLAQTWPNKELLVVDDGSTDGTYELVQRLYPQVDIVRREVNRGSVAARNDIVRRARGKYIFALDDDSYLVAPDACSRVVERMEAEPDLGIVSFQILGPEFPERSTPEGRWRGEWHASCYAACGAALRSSLLQQIGNFPDFFFHMYEEPDLCLRAWNAGFRVLQWNEIEVFHHFSPQNRSQQRSHRYHARNEAWSIWMRYPWSLVLPATAVRLFGQARYARARGWLRSEPRIWGEIALGLPQALRHRNPVSSRAVKIALAVNRFRVADPEAAWQLGEWSWMEILSAPRLPNPLPAAAPTSSLEVI